MESPRHRRQASPSEPDALRIGLDFDAVGRRLAECAIDVAAHGALRPFAAVARNGRLSEALRQECRILTRAGASVSNLAAAEMADRFSLQFAGFPEWDLTPGWLNELAACWLDLLARGGRPDGLDAFASRALGHCIVLASDPAKGASQAELRMIEVISRMLFFLTSVLADATAAYTDAKQFRFQETDALSGLPNLRRALTTLATALDNTQDSHFLAVVVLRIEVSPALLRMPSSLAHELLETVIDRVKAILRPRDVLFAGTEWELVAILPALASAAHVSLATTRLLQMFDEPFPVLGHEYRLVPAVGAAVFPEAGRQPEGLLQAARLALHEAQRNGTRNEVYRTEMEQSAARHAAIEHGFLEALREGELELYLQPQVDARSGQCRHAEALLRWPRTAAGNVAPSCIVAIAEDARVGPEFSRWLVTRAARTLAEFAEARIPLHLSINLTANDLRDHELPDVVEHALALWKVPADRLTLELTESAMIADEPRSLGIMRRLRELGCSLALDDFGTGYSSMAYLRQLPLNELKIDQVFIRRMEESAQDREIVRSMVQLAHSLRLEVVAEGVETEAARRLLDSYACQRLQGYYFSKPMPLADFVRWWHTHQG